MIGAVISKKNFFSLFITGYNFPKLHSWKYYIISAICNYGILNSLLTEIYKTLYKKYIKNLYRSLNRKNIIKQLINAIKKNFFKIKNSFPFHTKNLKFFFLGNFKKKT